LRRLQAGSLHLRKRACNLAHADFRHPPVIEDVDLSAYAGLPGQFIRVRAVDDFGVVGVAVVISTLDGAVLDRAMPARRRTRPFLRALVTNCHQSVVTPEKVRFTRLTPTLHRTLNRKSS
jgi:hypothetical protein